MSKKDYEAIAKRLNFSLDYHTPQECDTAALIATLLADYFVRDNPRFDKARFLHAAGVK